MKKDTYCIFPNIRRKKQSYRVRKICGAETSKERHESWLCQAQWIFLVWWSYSVWYSHGGYKKLSIYQNSQKLQYKVNIVTMQLLQIVAIVTNAIKNIFRKLDNSQEKFRMWHNNVTLLHIQETIPLKGAGREEMGGVCKARGIRNCTQALVYNCFSMGV